MGTETCNLPGNRGLIAASGVYKAKTGEVSNFVVENVIPLLEAGSNGEAKYLHLTIQVSGKYHEAIVRIDDGNYTKQIAQLVPFAKVFGSKANNQIDAIIFDLYARYKGSPATFFPQDGLYHLNNGSYVYLAGSDMIGKESLSGKFYCSRSLDDHHLVKSCLDERSACIQFLDGLKKELGEGSVAWSYTLLSSLRSAVGKIASGVFPVLFVSGQQSFGKTQLVERFCLLCDDENGNIYGKREANSTDKGILQDFDQHRDHVLLIDDLAKTSSHSNQQQRLSLVSEILRTAANGTARITAGNGMNKAQQCRCGVAFTGEMDLCAASELTRMISLQLDHKLCGSNYKADRAAAATVFRNWMSWLLPQLDRELDELKRILQVAAVPDKPQFNSRLIDTGNLLIWVHGLFLNYCEQMNILNAASKNELQTEFKKKLYTLFQRQQELVDRVHQKVPRGNLAYYILSAYQQGYFHIVKRKKDLKSDSDAYLDGDILYIRMQEVLDCLQRLVPEYNTYSKNKLGKALREAGIVPSDYSEGKTASARLGNGKKRRYLPISLPALKRAAIQY